MLVLDALCVLSLRFSCVPFAADESGSDEDFMVEDDDDSDYGHSKKRGKKVIRRRRTDKEKKSPKPRLKATGEATNHSAAAGTRDKACVLTPSCVF